MNNTLSNPNTAVTHLSATIQLPASKSESNRLLILQALSNGNMKIVNFSTANDTLLLQKALNSKSLIVNIDDAGTAMRFLTSFFAMRNEHKIVKGTDRMHQRPVHDLVEALHQIGFRINYLGQPGFPPIEIIPVNLDSLNNKVTIDGSISSQFISSLMMIGASLPHGLEITITGEVASKPYILLTAALMRKAGIESAINFPIITIAKQEYKTTVLSAGDDWTNAGYWYSFVALYPSAAIVLEGLEEETAQGDKILLEWGNYFGVKSEFKQGALYLSKLENTLTESLHFDFTPHPDLAQTIIVLCAAKGIQATFSGLQSLRIKETDRIAALQAELKKFDVELVETLNGNFTLEGKFVARPVTIETYNDHRMAMCFAPLAVLAPITFTDPSVVSKSYPDFWNQMAKLLTWDE